MTRPIITRRQRMPIDVPLPDYYAMKAQRLEAGRIEYGDRSARTKTLMRLAMEIREEFADVGGWARIFRDRCELRNIAIPSHIDAVLRGLDMMGVVGFAALETLTIWARGAERGE